jgi:DNA-binding SARP family transcriptional activator/DNA-binding XRE family transcriptional regulator
MRRAALVATARERAVAVESSAGSAESALFDIGSVIKAHRTAQGLTQRELADAAGVALGTLRDLEQGRTANPSFGVIQDLAAVLGIDGLERQQPIPAARGHPRLLGGWLGRSGIISGPGRMIRINLLGPMEVWRDGLLISLGSARQRAVLGLLALEYGNPVHRDVIIDVLWGAEPPDSAITQVQGYLSRLRRLLRTDFGSVDALLITSARGCYCLQINDPDVVDLAAFRQLVDFADRAAASRQPAEASRYLGQALSMWRGDPLADIGLLRDYPAVTELSHGLSEAVIRCADESLKINMPDNVLRFLRALCERDRYNEPAHARLMMTLAAAGQQAAALEVFAVMRRRLKVELGLSPTAELAATHLRVLRQERGWV